MSKPSPKVDQAFLQAFEEVLERAAELADLFQREVQSLREEKDYENAQKAKRSQQ